MVRLGPYLVDRSVGKGGMGEVFSGMHEALGAPVAIKVLTGAETAEDAARAAFRNEVRLAASLDHPGIVEVYDQGEVEAGAPWRPGTPYVVMEWVGGGTLGRVAPAPDWAALRAILLGLLDALGHAHARKIIHRDLKPGNVLLSGIDDWSSVRLVDFGIAVLQGERSGAEVTTGTPAYMAPEQIRGEIGEQGAWTDLYALGCLGWRLATGWPPFRGGDGVRVMRAHLREPPPTFAPAFAVPRELEGWMRVLLDKQAHRRFHCASDAAHVLRGLGDPDVAGQPATGRQWDSATPTTVRLDGLDGLDDPTADAPDQEGDALRVHAPLPADWRVSGPRAGILGAGLLGIRPVPLAGREAERDRLWDGLLGVEAHRRPRAIVLHGAAGTGKSRLAEWCVLRARAAGALGLEVRHADPGGPSDGIGPALLRHLGAEWSDAPARAARIGRTLVDAEDVLLATALLAPSEASGVQIGSERERFAVVERSIRALAGGRPVVLAVDDAQWGADALRLVQHLLEADLPLLAVISARDDVLPDRPAERAALDVIRAHGAAQEIPIGALSAEAVGVLLHDSLGLDHDASSRLAETIGGNALLAVQLVSDLAQRGELVPEAGGFRIRAGAVVSVPEGLASVWESRLAAAAATTADGDLRALELAAVLGADVDAGVWGLACAAAGLPTATALVEELLARQLLRAGPDGPARAWSFVHTLLRQTLEARASAAGRSAEWHRACATVLAGRPGAEAEVGLHLLRGGRAAEAVPVLTVAGSGMQRSGNVDVQLRVAALLVEAFAAAGLADDDPARIPGSLDAARALRSSGEIELAERRIGEVLAIAASRGLTEAQSEANQILSLSRRYAGDRAGARSALEASLTALGPSRGPSWQRTRRYEAGLLLEGGRAADALELLEETLRAADSATGAEAAELAELRYTLGHVLLALGRTADAERELLAAREWLAAHGRIRSIAMCDNLLADAARARGDLDGAEARYRAALERFLPLGGSDAAIVEANLGLVLLARDRYDLADGAFTRALVRIHRLGWKPMVGPLEAARATCAAGRGDWRVFDAMLTSAVDHLRESGIADQDVVALMRRAAALADRAGETARRDQALKLADDQLQRMER